MTLRIPNSIEDFRELREKKFEYIDKSHMITEFIERDGHKVVLLPRPRRFGKSLNLSMLRWFFEKRDENLWHLFADLDVARADEKYRVYFQQFPVICINFKGTKADTFETCLAKILDTLQETFRAHEHVLQGKLDTGDSAKLRAIMEGTANQTSCELALKNLTRWLYEVHGKRPIVLIDEYDAPIHSGHAQGYYAKAVSFCRSFYEAGLKDNLHLERAVMTGILRVAKESIFSGLNNPGVYSLLESEFSTCFGFTENEVSGLLQKAGLQEIMGSVRAYYDGYEFGGHAIYNPWSILEFLGSDTKELLAYWANTSENALVKGLLHRHAFAVEKDIQTLLEGGYIERKLNDNIVFPDLDQDSEALWNILVFSGYLKAARPGPIVVGQPRPPYRLSIPNIEVAEVYRTTFRAWLDKGLTPAGGNLQALVAALLEGNTDDFAEQLQNLVTFIPSYQDVRGAKPEQFYHGLMIGLLAALEPDYEVRSNRESGHGRPDVMIKPRTAGKPGVVLELKVAGKRAGRTMRQALDEGLLQMQENDYAAELRAAGIPNVHAMVIAFDGKKVKVAPYSSVSSKRTTGTKTLKKTARRKRQS